MYIYNVTLKIERSIERDWLSWMCHHHIPDVMATQLFVDSKIMRVIVEEEEEESATYAIQYRYLSPDHFEVYQRRYAKALQAEHIERYRGQFVAFRTLMEEVNIDTISA
jgi:hypothetical protein